MRLSPHFTSKEFPLDGRTDFYIPVPHFLLVALEFYREQIKAEFDTSIIEKYSFSTFGGLDVKSYARSLSYNEKHGGHPNSHHLYAPMLRKEPDAVDFTTLYFSEYDHAKHLMNTREHLLQYGIFLSTGLYPTRRFIHFNLEQSKAEMRKWVNNK